MHAKTHQSVDSGDAYRPDYGLIQKKAKVRARSQRQRPRRHKTAAGGFRKSHRPGKPKKKKLRLQENPEYDLLAQQAPKVTQPVRPSTQAAKIRSWDHDKEQMLQSKEYVTNLIQF